MLKRLRVILLQKSTFSNHYWFFTTFCLVITIVYYLLFVNKGLVFLDEGYYVHISERILQGERPYHDFNLIYTPGFFYLLAFVYKMFSPSIIAGRILTLAICSGIVFIILSMLPKVTKPSLSIVFLSVLCLLSFGYPLINIPLVVWANVLVSLLALAMYLKLHAKKNYKSFYFSFFLGMFLALGIFFKQNIGVVFVLLFNILILARRDYAIKERLRTAFLINAIVVLFTLLWLYPLLLTDNSKYLVTFIEFSQQFASQSAFSYPSLSLLLQPFGIFKLLPYYLPIFFFIVLLFYAKTSKINWNLFAFCLTPLIGFASTMYPQTDLLHIYPFFGPLLVAVLVFFQKERFPLVKGVVVVLIFTGFYLTIFTNSYRYEAPYREQNTLLDLPRTKGIYVEKIKSTDLSAVAQFLKTHTKQSDYVFMYPDVPVLYFILERRNPSKDVQYVVDTWHFHDDDMIISEIQEKKVKYLLKTDGLLQRGKLSRYIMNQKLVYVQGTYRIYQNTTK